MPRLSSILNYSSATGQCAVYRESDIVSQLLHLYAHNKYLTAKLPHSDFLPSPCWQPFLWTMKISTTESTKGGKAFFMDLPKSLPRLYPRAAIWKSYFCVGRKGMYLRRRKNLPLLCRGPLYFAEAIFEVSCARKRLRQVHLL